MTNGFVYKKFANTFPQAWCKRPSIALWLLVSFFSINCSHTPAKPSPIPENKERVEQIIVEEGESSQPVYARKGDKILYVSKHRPGHAQDQVYEKDLNSGNERRITFQNGTTMGPHYNAKENMIIYASSTDELKENPPLLYPVTGISKLPFPYQEPTEIYVHALNGFLITRLTERRGFDGEARFSRDDGSVTFTRVRDQKTEILELNRASKTVHPVKGLGVNPTQYVTSPDGRTHAWVEWDASFGVGRLRVQRVGDLIKEINGEKVVAKSDLNFSPDSKWLLWAEPEPEPARYALWVLELKAMCAQRLLPPDDSERRDPTVSSDMRWLAFTLKREGRSRIARIGFTPPTGPCSARP